MRGRLSSKLTEPGQILRLSALGNLLLLCIVAAFAFHPLGFLNKQKLLALLFTLTALGVVGNYWYSTAKIAKQNAQRDALLRQLAEAQSISKIGSWEWDLVRNHLTWSSEHYKIFEIPEPQRSEDLFQLFRSRIYPEDRKKLNTLIADFSRTGKKFTYDYRLAFEDGRMKHVQLRGRVIQDEAGNAIRFNGTCQDVTERKRARAALRASEEFNLSILNSVASEISVLDRDGTIIAVNEPWKRFSLENSATPHKPDQTTEVGAKRTTSQFAVQLLRRRQMRTH